MKAIDVVIEAAEYGVLVAEDRYGTTRFHAASFEQDEDAWCSRVQAGRWICHNSIGACHHAPSKAKAYDWCLEQAANGLTTGEKHAY